MCFSAGASFASAAVLGSVGLYSLKHITKKSEIMFAAIPLLFGIQQATEGVLWLSLANKNSTIQDLSTNVFLFFAQILWTTWIPISFLQLEPVNIRKRTLQLLSMLGVICSLLLCYRLIYQNIYAKIQEHHIAYVIVTTKSLMILNAFLYISSVVVPCFVSSVKKAWLLGVLLTGSLLVTKLFYEEYLVSVWCYFAAILSIVIIYIMRDFKKRHLDGIKKANL